MRRWYAMSQKGSVFGAVMLVAGTSIGGGILAFPVVTGETGFIPSIVMMLFGWAFMTVSALFLVEASLWMEEGSHILTMTSRLLGPLGKGCAWLLFLFISYASLVGYIAGGGRLVGAALNLPNGWSFPLFAIVFGGCFFISNVLLGRINALLMIGAIGCYVVLVGGGIFHIKWGFLARQEWGAGIKAFPLLLTIFSFQTIVPSLSNYLNRDRKALKRSIIIGTLLALGFYILWQALVLGTILYDGDQGLAAALLSGVPATEFLGVHHKMEWFGPVADSFAFFALATSFIGIGFGLYDFLADALRISKRGWGILTLGFLIIAPSLFFALTIEKVFLLALDLSGGVGDSILNCIFPALMVFSGRYLKNYPSEGRTFGGKGMILFVVVYGAAVLAIEILGKFGVVQSVGG